MSSILNQLKEEVQRLRASAVDSTPYPRIMIPGSPCPPPVLQRLHGLDRPVLLPDGRQPSQWSEVHWLAGQGDGDYVGALDGRIEIIRVIDGVVKTCAVEDIKKWNIVGRVARETEGDFSCPK